MATRRTKPAAPTSAFAEGYPALTSFVVGSGRVELGEHEFGDIRGFIAVVALGRWFWEGKPSYDSIEEAFDDAEQSVRRYRLEMLDGKLSKAWTAEKPGAPPRMASSPRRRNA